MPIAIAFVLSCIAQANEEILFFSSKLDQTLLADGSPLPSPSDACGWKWQPDKGSGGVWESLPHLAKPPAILLSYATDLEAGEIYEVFAYFWAQKDPSSTNDSIQLGLSLATLHPFDGDRTDELVQKHPWVITPSYKTGEAFGLHAIVEEEDPLMAVGKLVTSKGEEQLIRARLGFSRTSKDCTIPVFFSSPATGLTTCASRLQGIAVRRAPVDASPHTGRKAGTMLHLAIRAGDTVTLQRELDAGGDINAFDEENLTPLFYAAASGDAPLVRKLLDLGAKPEQPGQSIAPLTAAATIAHPEILGMLLKQGAKVPTELTREQGALATKIDPRQLHPVIAAIQSGSIPALKMLMAANLSLNLPEFEKSIFSTQSQPKSNLDPQIFLLGDAMLSMDWDMAAFLIDQGAAIRCRAYDHWTSPQGLMLADTVHAWPDSRPAMEAMLRRGEPVVTNPNYQSDDALNTAVLHGHAELIRRFLPHAREVSLSYQNHLWEKALASGSEEVIAMIRARFPDAQAPRWAPPENTDNSPKLEESASRWFLPRTSPLPHTVEKAGKRKRVLAIVADPNAQTSGDLLAVHASQTKAWQVVDRQQIETTLEEASFSKPWLDGSHRLSDLGDQLNADCIVVISTFQIREQTLHRFEIVDVTTGLEIHREHFKSDVFVDEKEVAGFLERAAQSLEAANAGERRQAVTMLTFSTLDMDNNSFAANSLFRAAIQHEVDVTSGFISLSRSQSARLIEEQALGCKDSVWAAAHMLEGSISAHTGGTIKITLRLETIKSGEASTKTDAHAIGKPSEIAETARAAWKKLMSTLGNNFPAPLSSADPSRALSEGRRLMREVDWLHAIHADPASYVPMIESAIALGVPLQDTILIDLDARFRHFLFMFPKNSFAHGEREGKNKSSLQHISDIFNSQEPSLARSDQLAHNLPLARELIHQTSWYLERMGSDGLNGGTDIMQIYNSYKGNEIWYSIQALSSIRAWIIPSQLPEGLRPEFASFSSELDELTTRYFFLLKIVSDADFYRYYLQIADFRLIKHNPALANGLVEMVTTSAAPSLLLRVSDNGVREFQWMPACRAIAKKMLTRIADDPSPLLQFSKADIECYLADFTQRPNALKKLSNAAAAARWHVKPTRSQRGKYLASERVMQSASISRFFAPQPFSLALDHNGSMISSLLFSSQSAPDISLRFANYHQIFQIINQREAWREIKMGASIDAFRASIGGYYPWELRRLQSLVTEKKTVNGRPSRTGTSIRHGPPSVSYKPESKHLYDLIFGAGKKTQQQVKPSTEPPKPPATLHAELLTDLRISDSPGTFMWPFMDKADSNFLWVFHFPSETNVVPCGNGASNWGPVYDKYHYNAPWLLCINCKDGALVQKINLHSAIGEAYGIDISHRKCEVWNMSLDQTNDRILTSVGWHDKNYAGNKMGSVIIDKKTGKAHPIPRNPAISKHKGGAIEFDLWDGGNGVVAVGDHFFFLDDAGDWTSGAIKGMRSDDLAIFHVAPDLSVKPLTMMGRRPELTPFDAQNRAPIAIKPHDNRLMVIHPAIIAEFDPVANSWIITASEPDEKPSNEHTNPVVGAYYWEHLRSLNELRINGETTEWIAVSLAMKPGVLPFASRKNGWYQIPIEVVIPNDFLEKTFAIEEIRDKNAVNPEKKTLMKDHPRFSKPIPIVLAQTDTDMILGVQTNSKYEWIHPTRNSHHLPFLWKVSKKKLLTILDAQ